MPATAKVWRWPLHWQIILSLLIGAGLGLWVGATAIGSIPEGTDPDRRGAVAGAIATEAVAYQAFDLLGDLFLNGLKLIIVPLVVSSIILAVANIVTQGERGEFGRLGSKTLVYYLATSTIAILIGLTLINFVAPGYGEEGTGILAGRDLSQFADAEAEVQNRVGGKEASDFLDTIRSMVPPNVINAAAEGQLLGLIVVSLLVGYFIAKLAADQQSVVRRFVEAVYHVTLSITDVVLRLAPIGVLALIAATFAEQFAKLYPDARFAEFLIGISQFAAVALAALLIHFLVTMPLILMFIARVNPLRHYKAMAPALATAFSTASSSATLPVTLDCVEKRAGVSNKTASFVLPLGATVNMDGTALYECVAAIFICQAFGLDLTFGQQFLIVITALLTSVGVAGVPSASLVAIAVILGQVEAGLAAQGISVSLISGMALLFVFDRPLDMCRTAMNIFSDSVGAVTIARTEGETDVLADPVPMTTAPTPSGPSTHGPLSGTGQPG